METKVINTSSRRYTFEATRRSSGQCYIKVTISTHDLSPHKSLSPNPGRHEFRESQTATYQNCLNGMRDIVKDDQVMVEASEWAETLS